MEQKFIQLSPKNQRGEDKYVRKIMGIYIYIYTKIQIQCERKKFRLERGGKEGDPISPNMFTRLLEYIFIKEREQQTLP
jgi:hypothetical protein